MYACTPGRLDYALVSQKVSAIATPCGQSGSASEIALAFRTTNHDKGTSYNDTNFNWMSNV